MELSLIAWTVAEGIAFCQTLEPFLIVEGYHVALGGSVLTKGYSIKDLDIFIYPHKTEERGLSPAAVMAYIAKILLLERYSICDHSNYKDAKVVFYSQKEGKRIDFFFVA